MKRPNMPAVMDEYGVHRVLAVNECGCATFHLRDAGAPTIPPHIARRNLHHFSPKNSVPDTMTWQNSPKSKNLFSVKFAGF